MKFSELKLEYSENSGYYGARVHYGEYILSIINKKPSVLYEIAVMDAQNNNNFVRLPGIIDSTDHVRAGLTRDDVEAVLTKMYTITGNSGILI